MPKSHSFKLKFTLVLSLLALLLIAVHLVLQYLNLVVFYEKNGVIFELSNRFDLDDEVSVPTWFSQFLLLAIAFFCGLSAMLHSGDKAKKAAWWLLAGLGAALSIDESASLHEFILQVIHVYLYNEAQPTLLSNAWWYLLPFILILAGALAIYIFRKLPKKTAIFFIVGGSLFLIGSVGFDAVNIAVEKASFANQGLLVAAEETLEIAGSLVILYAVISYLENNFGGRLSYMKRQIFSKK